MISATASRRPNRILITGASGFLGTRLVERWEAAGQPLCLLSRQARPANVPTSQWRTCELTDAEAVRSVVNDFRPDVIVHLASLVAGARDRSLVVPMLQANLLSTIHLLNAAAETGARCVLAGSMEAPVDGHEAPASPYAAAKWAMGGYARMFHSLYDVSSVVLRIFMVYGPGQNDRTKLTPHLCEALLRGESPALSSGLRAVDWIYVDDVVDAILLAADRSDLAGETLDVGSGKLVTVRRFAEELGRLVNPQISLRFGAIPDRPRETANCARIDRTAERLGWKPRTPIEIGLRRTVEWYRQQHLGLMNTIDPGPEPAVRADVPTTARGPR